MGDWHSPLPLLEWKSGGKIELVNNTVSLLEKINKPLVIPCIVGSSRTGKSFLMNRLSGQKTGFPLGNTIQSKTKGIWVWYKTHPNDPNLGLLLMDTEGLDDPEMGDENDTAVQCLSLLLSSTFIFNVIGKVDNTVIDKMDFVTEISKHICMKSDATKSCGNISTDFYHIFRHFVLVCRDKLLQLEINGKQVTPDEYMERFMLTANKEVTTETGMKRNLKKMKLRKYFPNRKCFFFPRPAKNDEDMKHLEELTDTDLQTEFLKESEEFCSYILTNSAVKVIDVKGDDIDINGERFVYLVRIYVDAMNDNQIPCMATAYELLASYENQKLLDDCLSKYTNLMSQLKIPLEASDFDRMHIENQNIAMDQFTKKVFMDENNECWRQLKLKIEHIYAEFMLQNRKISRRICVDISDGLYQTIQKKLKNGSYNNSNGYENFVQDSDKMRSQYESVPNKGEMANAVLEKYQNLLRKDQKNLLRILLEEAQQKEEEEKLELAESKAKLKVERTKSKQMEDRLKMMVDYCKQERIVKKKKEEKLGEFSRKCHNFFFQIREQENKRLFEEDFEDEGIEMQIELEAAQREKEAEIRKQKKNQEKDNEEMETHLEEIDNLRQRLEVARQESREPGFLDLLFRLGERCIDKFRFARTEFDSDEYSLMGWLRTTTYFVGLVLRLLSEDDDDDDSI